MPEEKDTNREGETGQRPTAPANAEPVSQRDQARANTGEAGPNEKIPHWADRTVAVFTVLIFLTYITSNYFACQTLREIKNSGNDTHDLALAAKAQADVSKAIAEAAKAQAGSTKDIADRALAQATATNILAVESKRAADIATKSLNIQSRPWVGIEGEPIVTGIRPIDKETAELTFQFTMKNLGAQPAFYVGLSAGTSPAPAPFRMEEFNKTANMECGQASGWTRVPGIGDEPSGVLMFPGNYFIETRRGRIKASANGVFDDAFVVGCISYSDQLGNRHQTRFCFGHFTATPITAGERLTSHAFVGNKAN